MRPCKRSGFLRVAPSRGRGLKPEPNLDRCISDEVAPSRGRGLKRSFGHGFGCPSGVAPSRGRGLKHPAAEVHALEHLVAPSRGRGLKLHESAPRISRARRRPFAGAWIETRMTGGLARSRGWSPLRGGVD